MKGIRSAAEIETVAVVGAGNMGQGIAQVFAQTGRRVNLLDVDEPTLERAVQRIASNVKACVEGGLLAAEQGDLALSALRPTTSLSDAVGAADYVVEAATESLPLKRSLFRAMDAICPPDVVLATNTSSFKIADIASDIAHPQRAITTHFWMPAHLLPLVEVVGSEKTDPEAIQVACDLLAGAGKVPVVVRKDVPGFIGNRLQHALVREAISIVNEGIADAEDVDTVVKLSFGMRLAITGPLEAMDLAGLDLVLSIHDYLLGDLCRETEPSPLLRALVAAGKLGSKTGEGFRRWTPEQAEAIKAARDADLMARLRAARGPR